MDDYPMYGLLVGFSLWGTLWRFMFPVGFWNTFSCRVETKGGTTTHPYTPEEEAKATAILKERREEAKKKALLEAQAAKLKKIEGEMAREKERLKKEEEAKLKEVEEEEEEDEQPLERRTEQQGQYSGSKNDEMEKRISEWVANLSLGEEEVAMYIPKDEQETAMKEWDAEEDSLKRQAMEDEKKMEWRLRMMREKKRRVDAASEAAKELEQVKNLKEQLTAQVDLQRKVEVIAQSVDRLARVQGEQYEFSRSQDMVVRSMWMGFRDFARELVGAVGSEVNHRLEKTERFCVGAIEGVKLTAPKEEEARPRREPIKVKFPDSYSRKREETLTIGRPTSRPIEVTWRRKSVQQQMQAGVDFDEDVKRLVMDLQETEKRLDIELLEARDRAQKEKAALIEKYSKRLEEVEQAEHEMRQREMNRNGKPEVTSENGQHQERSQEWIAAEDVSVRGKDIPKDMQWAQASRQHCRSSKGCESHIDDEDGLSSNELSALVTGMAAASLVDAEQLFVDKWGLCGSAAKKTLTVKGGKSSDEDATKNASSCGGNSAAEENHGKSSPRWYEWGDGESDDSGGEGRSGQEEDSEEHGWEVATSKGKGKARRS
ncbi:hypothetical protein CBR_g26447 [Chara braunii]|uniref:Uncharacterized protein n=1 Tax=Chara braunii TaxID=69332 RepID=A0A388L7Y4_CHABU|nr:hypothetical protein CBR_g26447 [Chara braunii]|eukprot:GBG78419.1 hypothetical protein CBR_g26447 [Chara braunii]